MKQYFIDNVLPMQPQEKRNYQSFRHCDDETTCEWSWFMFEASLLTPRQDASLASIGPDEVGTVCKGFAVPAVLDFT